MRRFVPSPVPALAALVVVAAPAPAPAQSAPAGWQTARLGAAGAVVYTPPDLSSGEVYSLTVFPPEPLAGKTLTEWLSAAAARAAVRLGTPATPLAVKDGAGAAAEVAATGIGTYTSPAGVTLTTVFIAVSADGRRVCLLRVAASGGAAMIQRYGPQMNALAGQLGAAARADAAPTSALAPPPQAATGKIVFGGAITPGLYVGQQRYGSDPPKTLRLYLYADGEYRMCDANDTQKSQDLDLVGNGHYKYDPRTGQIGIAANLDLVNNDDGVTDPDRSLYGRDAQGKPFVYGDNDHGFSHVKTALLYVGPTTRPAPEAEAAAKARADAEAKRYKWVVPPGKGVTDTQIASIVHDYQVRVYYNGGIGANTTDVPYLLLRDGTVHRELPVPPDQLDVARSRRMEPQAWGRWERQGDKYLASWAGGPLQPLPGRPVLPAPPGTRLAGHWGGGASSSSLAGGSYSLWGVTFTGENRFVKNESGGYGNSQFMQDGGAPLINSTYDDGGSYTLVAGGNFTVGTGRAGTAESHRSGTYAVRGYTMTLRYDDGRVERAPFFFESAARKELSFEGRMVGLDDGK